MKYGLLFVAISLVGPLFAQEDDLNAVIAERNRAYTEALLAGDAEALANFYTEDATTLFPGVPRVKGRKAILDDKRADFTQVTVVSADIQSLELSASGDLAYEIGTFVYTFAGRGGTARVVDGRYLLVWRRGEDGVWRIQVDAGLPR